MKKNWALVFLDILFLCMFAYGIFRYVYESNYRVLTLRLSLLLFAYVTYEHYKLYKNQKRIF